MEDIYLSVEDAAKRMGIKPRRMLDYADKIPSKRVPNPKSGKSVLMFQQLGIDGLVAERKKVAELGMGRANSGQVMRYSNHAIAAPQHVPVDILPSSIRLEMPAPRDPDAWLTISQAATEKDLPASVLRSFIETGRLPALDVGPRPGGRWRVKRADLSTLAGVRQNQPAKDGNLV